MEGERKIDKSTNDIKFQYVRPRNHLTKDSVIKHKYRFIYHYMNLLAAQK